MDCQKMYVIGLLWAGVAAMLGGDVWKGVILALVFLPGVIEERIQIAKDKHSG